MNVQDRNVLYSGTTGSITSPVVITCIFVCKKGGWSVLREFVRKGARSIAYRPLISVMQLQLQDLQPGENYTILYFAPVTPILQAAHA